jgi:hypothetical protein
LQRCNLRCCIPGGQSQATTQKAIPGGNLGRRQFAARSAHQRLQLPRRPRLGADDPRTREGALLAPPAGVARQVRLPRPPHRSASGRASVAAPTAPSERLVKCCSADSAQRAVGQVLQRRQRSASGWSLSVVRQVADRHPLSERRRLRMLRSCQTAAPRAISPCARGARRRCAPRRAVNRSACPRRLRTAAG